VSDLVAFLRARLDEDEAAARAARRWFDRDWEASQTQGRNFVSDDDGHPILETFDDGEQGQVVTAHIARWDPARVLADVAAKRVILDDYQLVLANNLIEQATDQDELRIAMRDLIVKSLRMVLARMAQPYAGHPGFDPAWRLDV